MPVSDIHFISRLELDQPVLFVISKADKKLPEQISSIVEIAKKDLDRNDVPYFDVIGYSAAKNTEYSTSGDGLNRFFREVGKGKDGSTFAWQANRIFGKYLDFYKTEKTFLRGIHKTVNELIFEENAGEESLAKLKTIKQSIATQINSLTLHERGAEQIKRDFIAALKELCQVVSIRISEQPTKVQIEALKKKGPAEAESHRFEAVFGGDPKQRIAA